MLLLLNRPATKFSPLLVFLYFLLSRCSVFSPTRANCSLPEINSSLIYFLIAHPESSICTSPGKIGTDLSSLGANTSSIYISRASICTNLSSIGTNRGQIGTNLSSICTNPRPIGTNHGFIGTNGSSICTRQSKIGTNLYARGTNRIIFGEMVF